MGKQYRDNYSRPRQTGVDTFAEPYIPAIKKLLPIESASTDEIKAGVSMTESLVKNNKKITTHQIRNIYSLIKELEDNEDPLKKLHMLRPKLAYIGARQKENDGKVIIKVLDEIIKSIDEKAGDIPMKIKGLIYIMESIVAYHKFHSNN